MRSNLRILIARKAQDEQRRVTLRSVAADTGLSYYTILQIADSKLKEYPTDVLAKLCEYFNCEIGDLLYLVDA